MFDGIAYGKAGDVLLTVENYLGEETFRQGVHDYLAAHLYANATAEDFWNAQTAASHKPVDKIMESLVAQPARRSSPSASRPSGKVAVIAKALLPEPEHHSRPAQKWTLPVCFKTGSGRRTARFSAPTTPPSRARRPASSLPMPAARATTAAPITPSVYAALVARR